MQYEWSNQIKPKVNLVNLVLVVSFLENTLHVVHHIIHFYVSFSTGSPTIKVCQLHPKQAIVTAELVSSLIIMQTCVFYFCEFPWN